MAKRRRVKPKNLEELFKQYEEEERAKESWWSSTNMGSVLKELYQDDGYLDKLIHGENPLLKPIKPTK